MLRWLFGLGGHRDTHVPTPAPRWRQSPVWLALSSHESSLSAPWWPSEPGFLNPPMALWVLDEFGGRSQTLFLDTGFVDMAQSWPYRTPTSQKVCKREVSSSEKEEGEGGPCVVGDRGVWLMTGETRKQDSLSAAPDAF